MLTVNHALYEKYAMGTDDYYLNYMNSYLRKQRLSEFINFRDEIQYYDAKALVEDTFTLKES